MKGHSSVTTAAAALLIALFTASAFTLHKVESLRGKEATLEEVLYLPSGKTLKRLSLGYSGLLANIYWTRAVQYFGAKRRERSEHYDLLAPLLDITTDLDPRLIVAYETGSIFLSQRPPEGAGEPEKAVALVEKGIRANPEYWRLYFTLGFIHYLDRKDFKAAQQAFQKGSEVPGALPWMRVMAARMAEKGNTTAVALELWNAIYQTSKDPMVRDTALKHIVSLQAATDVEELSRRVEAYRQNTGALPSTWGDLVRAGLLRAVPRDPTGSPYRLMPDGTVGVEEPDKFPFLAERTQPK
jgi:tetratricopeptide (TPR) repeat protein